MAIIFTKQPDPISVVEKSITETIEVQVTGATSYQWKKAVTADSVSGATVVADQTTTTLTIPKDLMAGEHYFFCAASDESSTSNSKIAVVTVLSSPEYITGNYVNNYISNCAEEVKERFENLKTLSGIEIPSDDNALRTAQIELFMSAL